GEEEDVRGRQIIDLVGAANLVVENDRDSIPTFETANGKSWIDITLSRDLGSQRRRNAQRSQEYLFQGGPRRGGKRPTEGKEEDHDG
ncbi:unnamed protein product, partial [Tenebrio molitor]